MLILLSRRKQIYKDSKNITAATVKNKTKSEISQVSIAEVDRWYKSNERTFLNFHKGNIKAECPSFPMNIFIEPINACNMACPFCTTILATRDRKLMPLSTLEKVLDDLLEAKIYPRLTFTGEGEPFLNKQTCDMIAMARARGFNTWSINNGTMLTKQRIDKLIAAKLNRIQFSIDSIKPEVYEQIRISKGNHSSYYNQVMGNILHFIKRNYEAGSPTYVTISSVQNSLNVDEEKSFTEFWYSLPVNHVFLQPLSTIQGANPSGESEGIFFKGDQKSKPVCSVPFGNAIVNSDGSVNLCTHDYDGVYSVGNVIEESFVDIWNNEKSKKLRQALIDGEVEEFVKMGHDCAKCNNPLIGYGMEDYHANSNIRLKRLRSALDERSPVDGGAKKFKNLKQQIENFPHIDG
jgi:radical SAM protein with 4Fe4S-binding SPASM domain